MNQREEQIQYSSERAQEDTFDWVLSQDNFNDDNSAPEYGPDKNSFCKWLHGTDRLFWICGKAGSGKSTLMRKICRDSRLQRHLDQWAPEGTITLAKMFFTTEGTELQRSQEGLLRSLLYEALVEPTLAVQVLAPYLSKSRDAAGKISWTLAELCTAFNDLLQMASTTQRFCFFVDGLDEYNVIKTTSAYPPEYHLEIDKEEGRKIRSGHRRIAKLLFSATSNDYVKICVSSRPSNEIHSVFSGCPTFRLELLTKRDTESFVGAQVSDCVREMSQTTAARYKDCADAIVEHASGVFLWISIATDTLFDGIVNGDKPLQVRAMLDDLPKQLGGPDGLYMNILERLDPQQRAEFWSIANIVLHARRTVTPLFLSFAVEASPENAIDMSVNFPDTNELSERQATIERRLPALGNLLEVNDHPSWLEGHVRVMHLTVREFLQRADVQEKLTGNTAISMSDINVILLSTCLITIKSLSHSRYDRRSITVKDALIYAARAESTTGLPQTLLLDHLNATMEIVCAPHPDVYHIPRSNRLHWHDREIDDRAGGCHDDFMSLAVQANLTLYVQQKLENGYQLADKPGRPLLAYAIIPRQMKTSGQLPDDHICNTSMIQFLLYHHANPNAVSHFDCHCWAVERGAYNHCPSQHSIWQNALASVLHNLYGGSETPDASSWAEMVKTLLEHGASPTETVWWDDSRENRAPRQLSALFVCMSVSMRILGCDTSLPTLLISKGGRLVHRELDDLSDYAFSDSCLLASRSAFLRSFFPHIELRSGALSGRQYG